LNELIIKSISESETLTTSALTKKLSKAFPDLTKASISWRLHKLKTDGLIHSSSYGVYSLTAKQNFTPNLSSSVKRLFNRIRKEYPDMELCVWESKWFDEFLPEEADSNFIVIEVEKEFLERVFNSLTDLSKKVFLDPDADILSRYISNLKDAIIIKPIISESPCFDFENVKVAALEKLFVDRLAEPDFFAFLKKLDQQSILKVLTERYNLSISKMKRYSKRRSQHQSLSRLLSKLN
jgi:hypothetical protein